MTPSLHTMDYSCPKGTCRFCESGVIPVHFNRRKYWIFGPRVWGWTWKGEPVSDEEMEAHQARQFRVKMDHLMNFEGGFLAPLGAITP